MTTHSRIMTVVLVALLAVLGGACSSKPKVETAPAEQPTPAPQPTPTPVVEEVVQPPPRTETIVSEEVTEELPEDLMVLNARGYLSDVFFETDLYDLDNSARELLAANATWLRDYSSVMILVEGHCDERNTREYNLALGERRANTVRDYLVFLGIAPQRIRTISYGEEKPFALGHDESAWKLNRRSHFVITAH